MSWVSHNQGQSSRCKTRITEGVCVGRECMNRFHYFIEHMMIQVSRSTHYIMLLRLIQWMIRF